MVPTLKRKESEGENNKPTDKNVGKVIEEKSDTITQMERTFFQQLFKLNWIKQTQNVFKCNNECHYKCGFLYSQ